MMFARTIVRSLPGSVARLCRPAYHNSRIFQRQGSAVLHSQWSQAFRPQFAATFSSSRTRQEAAGEVDGEIATKLESELQLEKEMRDLQEMPTAVRDYLENGPFEIHDQVGKEEIIMTRRFGNEKILVAFSISDLNELDQDSEKYDDRALYDEDDDVAPSDQSLPTDGQSGGAQSKGTINAGRTEGGNIKVAPEDSVSPADRRGLPDDESADADDEDSADMQEPTVPIRVEVTVEKAGKGALQFETVVTDGMISIENVYHYNDSTLANTNSADRELSKRDMYLGPPFVNLDEDLQVMLERYLDERGVNTALALFVPDYADLKEQREYVRWLGDVQSFINA